MGANPDTFAPEDVTVPAIDPADPCCYCKLPGCDVAFTWHAGENVFTELHGRPVDPSLDTPGYCHAKCREEYDTAFDQWFTEYSAEQLRLAREAVASQERHRDDDVEEWARRIAEGVCGGDVEEQSRPIRFREFL